MDGNMVKLTRPDWSMMLSEILEQIWKRMTIPHQAQVSTVCKKWYSSTTNKASIWTPDIPWLLADEDNSSHYRLFSVILGKPFFIPKPFTPMDYYASIIGSCKGWLVIESGDEIFILNLFSKVRIDLPPAMSSKPGIRVSTPLFFTMSTCAMLNPITVAGITFDSNLIWCNIGDKEWKGYISNEKYGNIAFHNDKLYAINKDGNKVDIFRFDNDKDELIHHDTICATIPTVSLSDTFDVYLVESKGNILVVKRYSDTVSIIDKTIGFDIFKVQERSTNGDHSPHLLVNVDSLGDQALFVSDFFCESLSANNCPQLRGNRIYFIGDFENGYQAELGTFLVDEAKIARELIRQSSANSPIWLWPRYAFECDCKCHPSPLWRPV